MPVPSDEPFALTSTRKGLLRAEFRDRFGAECVLQESSFQDEECVWLGVDVDIHGEDLPQGKMHLTRGMVQKLLPLLQFFARNGNLGSDRPFAVGTWVRGIIPDTEGVEGRIIHSDLTTITIQDQHRPGPEGMRTTLLESAELFWEPVTPPEGPVASWYDFLRGGVDED